MGKEERELSDVVVVIVEEAGISAAAAAEKLREIGLVVSGVDENECVIEGCIETEKISGIKRMEFVKYVRDVFSYLTEAGEEDDKLSSEADDAGA
jgi:hypothetical protein